MATANSTITLKGSTEVILDYLGCCVNRGIYPQEDFAKVTKYGLAMWIAKEEGLKKYLNSILNQLSDWLFGGDVQQLVVVVTSVATKEVVERWVFQIETDKPVEGKVVEKSQKEIQSEIGAVIRQITSSVSFLPLLEEACTFDCLVYTNTSVNTPQAWEESDPRYITNSAEVRLRSVTTKIHKVNAIVAYKTNFE